MKRQYLSPATEVVKFQSEPIAAIPGLEITSGKADGSDAMAKPTHIVIEEEYDEPEADVAELKGYTSRDLWED